MEKRPLSAVPTRRLGFQKSVVGNKTWSLHSSRRVLDISASSAIPVWTRKKKKRERERERKKENWRQRSIINGWNGRAKEGILASNPVAGHVTSEAGIRRGIIFERGSRDAIFLSMDRARLVGNRRRRPASPIRYAHGDNRSTLFSCHRVDRVVGSSGDWLCFLLGNARRECKGCKLAGIAR